MTSRLLARCTLSVALGSLAACGDGETEHTGQTTGLSGSGGQSASGAAGSTATAGGGVAGSSGAAGAGGAAGGAASGASGSGGMAGSVSVAKYCDPGAACFSCTRCGEGGASTDDACTADCGLASPCDVLDLYEKMPDPKIVACVMGALRDGTPAKLIVLKPGAISTSSTTFHVLAGRKAVIIDSIGMDFGCSEVTLTGPRLLKPASFFEECAKQTDPDALLECTNSAAHDCASP